MVGEDIAAVNAAEDEESLIDMLEDEPGKISVPLVLDIVGVNVSTESSVVAML
jgi:hypothetical protein